MTPHVPNLFALSAGVGPSIDTGFPAEYHSSSAADAIDRTVAVMVDKKRARPPETASRARKKVASELMAFESTNMDVSMGMDEGMEDGLGTSLSNSGKEASKTAGTVGVHSSNVRTLNLRQRKWNSVRKEWQEWHDVQATHASDTPFTTHVSDANNTITANPSGDTGMHLKGAVPISKA
ncbi:hypothetical protein BGZ68_003490 [Mortierella alpina]|nr:hypothetical protein BGZ68_003490 [Mortierella alpina]